MPLPPYWKVVRELKRIQGQIAQVPWVFWSPLFREVHDLTKHVRTKVTDGERPVQKDIAVFLIFQPKGLLPSLFHTLEHLNAKGYAVMLVSNHSLSEQEQAQLAPHCWKLMQRPNYGYDFGGYRDAILHLLANQPLPETLLVMNDSMWFPLYQDADVLDRFRTQENDIYGFVVSEYEMARDPEIHIQSYMFTFRKEAMERPEFRRFWRFLTVSSNKQMVIRTCEKRMTTILYNLGFTYGAEHRFSDVTDAISGLSDPDLEKVLRYQIEIGTRKAKPLEEILAGKDQDPDWRDKAMAFLDTQLFGKYLLLAHPDVLIGKLKAPLMKKDKMRNYAVQRRELLASDLRGQLHPTILAEIEGWDRPRA